ncbi:MAG: hypothetical protein ACYSVY_16185, partial [Planctomycetota bacterium]
MRRETTLLTLLLVLTCGVSAGCQNTIKIKIEKVIGVSSVSHNSQVGRAMEMAILAMDQVQDSCRDHQDVAAKYVKSLQANPEMLAAKKLNLQAVRGGATRLNTLLENLSSRAHVLRNECASYFEPASPVRSRTTPQDTLHRVVGFNRDFRVRMREVDGVFSKTLLLDRQNPEPSEEERLLFELYNKRGTALANAQAAAAAGF